MNYLGSTSQPADLKILASGLQFPEGPIACEDGSILLVEIAGKALSRILPDGTHQVIAELDGGPNGAALGPDGWCYICNSGGWEYSIKDGLMHPVAQSATPGWIERVNLHGGDIERLYTGTSQCLLQAPNDLVFDKSGGFWFTDHGKREPASLGLPGVFYGDTQGSALRHVIPGMVTPNGIGLSPDGRTLYVSETITRSVFAFDVTKPGHIASGTGLYGGRLLTGLPDNNYLDSLAVDQRGHICVACLNNGGIWDITPDGKRAVHTPLPDSFVTNICFGGADRQTAFVTLSSTGQLAHFEFPSS